MAKAAKDDERGGGSSTTPDAGLSLAEVLDVPALRGSAIVAGAAGAGRRVERLNVMEVPDILPWVKPGELLLTTGYPLHHRPEDLAGLVTELHARGLAALGVKLGRYLDELPPAVLAEADRLGFPIVRLPDGVAFDDILEQVLTSLLNRQAAELSRSEDVHRALVQVVLDGGGLPELAAEVAARLGAAVVVTGEDGRVLADGGDIETLGRFYGSRCFDGAGRLDDRRAEHRGPTVGGHDGLAGNHAVAPVVAGRTGHGRLLAHRPDGSLREPDLHTLERAATVAALAITKQLAVRAVESKYRADFLRDLITGQVPPERAVSQCAGLGWDIDRPVVVLTAELDRGDPEPQAGTLERFGADWQAAVRLRDPLAPVAVFHREVVAVLGLPVRGGIERLVRDLIRDVHHELPRDSQRDHPRDNQRESQRDGQRGFSTGVSRAVTGPAGIPAGYEQSRTAVRVGRRVDGDGAVAHFDRLGVHRLLSLVPDGAELRSFAAETLGALLEDDDLRRTLEVLLEQNCNVAEAARTLHFHYNTLRYRIAKLERLVGPFTTDAHLRLNLQVALQVSRMRGS